MLFNKDTDITEPDIASGRHGFRLMHQRTKDRGSVKKLFKSGLPLG